MVEIISEQAGEARSYRTVISGNARILRASSGRFEGARSEACNAREISSAINVHGGLSRLGPVFNLQFAADQFISAGGNWIECTTIVENLASTSEARSVGRPMLNPPSFADPQGQLAA